MSICFDSMPTIKYKYIAYIPNSNYDGIPNTSEIGKWSPSMILGQVMWIVQTPTVLVSNNIVIKFAKFEKYKSKSNKQLSIVWNVTPFEYTKETIAHC